MTGEFCDVRWQCPRCGRFVAESAVHSADRIDPSAYYGITSRTWADCPRCGEVNNPRLVEVRAADPVTPVLAADLGSACAMHLREKAS